MIPQSSSQFRTAQVEALTETRSLEQHAEQVLEFDGVRARLAEYACSKPGKELLLRLPWSRDLEEVLRLQGESAEMVHLLSSGECFPMAAFSDVGAILQGVMSTPGPLEPQDLLEIANILQIAEDVEKFLGSRKERYPLLRAKLEGVELLPEIKRAIRGTIGPKGEVLDSASSTLKSLRSSFRSIKTRLKRALEELMPGLDDVLQEPLITLRRERYVLPLKPNFRRALEGIVHDRSASGGTLFVEPLSVCPLNNRLAELKREEEEEVYRILSSLTKEVMARREALELLSGRLAELDAVFAKASYAREYKCHSPLISQGGSISLKAVRHPLLLADGAVEEVVPIDISLGDGYRQLLITGPNTGGKTVALKTLGLSALMAQAGVPIPAEEGSRLPLFRGVYADIGDEQSLQQSLSTFSGHMSNIVKILSEAGGDSLVLLDELGAGTDPDEGAALGVALLESLAEKGSLTVATTHHDALKDYAHRSEAARNASVEFDPTTLRPTFRLRLGTPGASNALLIARRLGLPESIVERARALRGEGAIRVEELVGRLAEDCERVASQKRELEEALRELALQKEEAEGELQEARRRHAEAFEEGRKKAEAFLSRAQREVSDLVARLRRQAVEQGIPAGTHERLIGKLRAELKDLEAQEKGDEERAPAPSPKVGDVVKIAPLGKTGTVLRGPDRGGKVRVLSMGKTMSVPLESLRPEKKSSGDGTPSGWEGPGGEREFSPELRLLGERVEEALDRVDKHLDEALLLGLSCVRIVHGKGTGALRKAIGGMLKDHPHVRRFYPEALEHGGWGVTVVELKG